MEGFREDEELATETSWNMEILIYLIEGDKKNLQEWPNTGTSAQRGRGISILQDIQNFTGQGLSNLI